MDESRWTQPQQISALWRNERGSFIFYSRIKIPLVSVERVYEYYNYLPGCTGSRYSRLWLFVRIPTLLSAIRLYFRESCRVQNSKEDWHESSLPIAVPLDAIIIQEKSDSHRFNRSDSSSPLFQWWSYQETAIGSRYILQVPERVRVY